jgi:hypothetical protein
MPSTSRIFSRTLAGQRFLASQLVSARQRAVAYSNAKISACHPLPRSRRRRIGDAPCPGPRAIPGYCTGSHAGCGHRAEIAHRQRPPEGGLSQHHVSVRREAAHIRASRFELVEMLQTFLRTEREASHEASDHSCFRRCRFIRRRDRHNAVSFDRVGRRNLCYALVARATHRGRRKQAPNRGV